MAVMRARACVRVCVCQVCVLWVIFGGVFVSSSSSFLLLLLIYLFIKLLNNLDLFESYHNTFQTQH